MGPPVQPAPIASALPKTVPPVLLPEILGFSPQLFLDDIINSANTAVADAVNAMEEFLQRWADQRAEKRGITWDATQDVEQGLIAFQTLLEYHTDVAFDFFEAWSLRNIFTFPSDLPVIVPHQAGLNLEYTEEAEAELIDEIASLRRQIENQRRLHRLYTRAVRKSATQRRLSEAQLARFSFLDSPSLDTLTDIPDQLFAMYQSMTDLPELDPATVASLTQFQVTEPGKREWETSKAGYLNWAVGQLLERVRRQENEEGKETSSIMDDIAERAGNVGTAADLRKALAAAANIRHSLGTVEDVSMTSQEENE